MIQFFSVKKFLKENTKMIELSECDKLTDVALEKISKCKSLAKIDLNSHKTPRTLITSNGSNFFFKYHSISIEFINFFLNINKGVSNLSQHCKYLHTILLRRCVLIDDVCIDTIVRNCSMLRNLNVANCPLITDNSLTSIGNHSRSLKSLNISGTQVINLKKQFLQKNKQLKIIHSIITYKDNGQWYIFPIFDEQCFKHHRRNTHNSLCHGH